MEPESGKESDHPLLVGGEVTDAVKQLLSGRAPGVDKVDKVDKVIQDWRGGSHL